jgi:hypothetical protein
MRLTQVADHYIHRTEADAEVRRELRMRLAEEIDNAWSVLRP